MPPSTDRKYPRMAYKSKLEGPGMEDASRELPDERQSTVKTRIPSPVLIGNQRRDAVRAGIPSPPYPGLSGYLGLCSRGGWAKSGTQDTKGWTNHITINL